MTIKGATNEKIDRITIPKTRATAERLGDGGLLSGLFAGLPDGFLADLIARFMQDLFACDLPTDGRDAQATVERHFDTRENNDYDRRFFARVSRSVRQAARKLGETITRKQSNATAKVQLDEIRTGDPTDLSEVIFELRNLPQR